MSDNIVITGARVHNLKNVDLTIPRNRLVVITGLSGSGKSSLAFDTIYAEGQRRYMETLSAYARQFLGGMERPDVDRITGLSPVISIEQKTTNKNPRSTVGTITEIYDFLRLLYARASEAWSHLSGEKMVRYSDDKIVELISEDFNGRRIVLLSPLVKGRKGHYRELFETLRRKGFLSARVDGDIVEISPGMKLDRYKNHNIELVIDKLIAGSVSGKRLSDSVATALTHGDGVMMVADSESGTVRYFSRKLMCPVTGISYNEPAPHTFSFNSPQGACPACNGLGEVMAADIDRIIPDRSLTIRKGALKPLGGYRNNWLFWQIEALGKKNGFTIDTPIDEIGEAALNKILYGSDEVLRLTGTPLGSSSSYTLTFDGVMAFLESTADANGNGRGGAGRRGNSRALYLNSVPCSECEGTRLRKESLWFRLDGLSIGELAAMDISALAHFLDGIEERLSERQATIASEALKEIRSRITFLGNVGLGYLSLNRSAATLSGGESQRIRLATQIGSRLVNVLYILDEPSIGLHQRDNRRLIDSLKTLRDSGNSVIVVEHDRDMIMSSDFVIDLGPGAGRRGGHVVASGTPGELIRLDGLTSDYLGGVKRIEIPRSRRAGNGGRISVKGATGNNLKNIDVEIPLGMLVCVTGVSGSGKSSLINSTLHPGVAHKLTGAASKAMLPCREITGTESVDKIIEVSQSPIGRTPRSNPATYTGLFGDIRKLFAQTPEAKLRGFGVGRFSFNVKGGRCESCEGAGLKSIEMNFLPDVYLVCSECNGKRYNRETLEVRYKGKTISDVLDMTVNMAVEFFHGIPSIYKRAKTLQDVGLGYIRLGQPSTTLSGGESQRVKLATELSRRDTGRTIYLLDEPTTGLHFEDVRVLLDLLGRLVDRGNTVVVIEHNMDVIKCADHIIDMGMEGGRDGGEIIATGTPEQVAAAGRGLTAPLLKEEFATSA